MPDEDRWKFLTDLDDEILKGGVILSEWCSFIVRETDLAFVAGAHLATIITATAGIETYLRSEYGGEDTEAHHLRESMGMNTGANEPRPFFDLGSK